MDVHQVELDDQVFDVVNPALLLRMTEDALLVHTV